MPYKLGSILKKYNIISEKDIDKTLKYQIKTGFRFGESLVNLNILKKEEIEFAISKQIEEKNVTRKKGLNFKELNSLFKRITSYRFFFFMTVFFSLLSALFAESIIGSITLGFIFDHIIPSGNVNFLFIFAIASVVAYFLGRVFDYLTNLSATLLNTKLSKDILQQVFVHINCLPYSFFGKFEKGDLLSRISENVEEVTRVVQLVFSTIFLNLFLFVYIIAILLMFDVKLTIITTVVMLLCIVFPALFSDLANKYIHKEPQLIGKAADYLKEVFINFRYIVSNNKQDNIKKVFANKLEEYYKNNFNKWIAWNLAFNIKASLNIIISAIIIYFGGNMVIDNQMTVGSLLAFYILVQQFFPRMDYLYWVYLNFQFLKANWIRVKEVIDYPIMDEDFSKHRTDFKRLNDNISVSAVSFKYSLQDSAIFENLNLNIKKNNIYSVIGESGTGKSTFLKILLGLYRPTEGNIQYDRHSIDKLGLYDLWANTGYMGQEPFIFENKSIYDNIKIGAQAIKKNISDEDIFEAAKKAQIYNLISNLPKGFETIPDIDKVSLSGGEKQRIALARIFLKDPFLLILDEPTAALDQDNTKLILDIILKSTKGKIILLSSHQLQYLRKIPNLIYFTKDNVTLVEKNLSKAKKYLENFKDSMEK